MYPFSYGPKIQVKPADQLNFEWSGREISTIRTAWHSTWVSVGLTVFPVVKRKCLNAQQSAPSRSTFNKLVQQRNLNVLPRGQ